MSLMMVQTKCKLNNTELFLKLFHIQCSEIGNNKYYEEATELEKWQSEFSPEYWREKGNRRLEAECHIMFVKGRLNFSCKSTTAANVDLTESLLDNWLKNNHITIDKIYYLRSLFAFFTNFSFQIYFSTAENRHKNNNSANRQLAKIRLEWISQSEGSIGRPLGFVIDRLNTSASLYRIAPCLNPKLKNKQYQPKTSPKKYKTEIQSNNPGLA